MKKAVTQSVWSVARQALGGTTAVLGFAAGLTPSARGQIHAVGFERPLVAVADSPKAEREGQSLQELAIEARKHGPAWLAGELEAFLEASPESAWAPSMRANLGVFYHKREAFTLALARLERAWEAVGPARESHAKRVNCSQ